MAGIDNERQHRREIEKLREQQRLDLEKLKEGQKLEIEKQRTQYRFDVDKQRTQHDLDVAKLKKIDIKKEEFISLRKEIENSLTEVASLEKNCLLAIGAIYTWIFTAKTESTLIEWACMVPPLLALFVMLRCLSIWLQISEIGTYLRKEYQGYEKHVEESKHIRIKDKIKGIEFTLTSLVRAMFWILLIIITFVVAVVMKQGNHVIQISSIFTQNPIEFDIPVCDLKLSSTTVSSTTKNPPLNALFLSILGDKMLRALDVAGEAKVKTSHLALAAATEFVKEFGKGIEVKSDQPIVSLFEKLIKTGGANHETLSDAKKAEILKIIFNAITETECPVNNAKTETLSEAIYFSPNKHELTPSGQQAIARINKFTEEYKDVKLKISSNTDTTGSIHRNNKLSKQRIDEVKKYLATQIKNCYTIETEDSNATEKLPVITDIHSYTDKLETELY